MHGSYRLLELDSDFHIYTSSNDVEALAASFPDYAPFIYAPVRRQPYRLILQVAPGLLVLVAGGLHTFVENASEMAPSSIDAARPTTSSTASASLAPAGSSPVVRQRGGAQRSMPIPDEGPVAKPSATASETDPVDRTMSLEADRTVDHGFQSDVDHVNEGGKVALAVIANGRYVGEAEFADNDQVVSVKLGSLLEIVSDRFEPDEYARLSASSAAQEFIPVDTLAAAGLPISYDPVYDEFNLGLPEPGSPEGAQAQEPSAYS